ncbi:MAG: flagellar motor switch protein FliM [Gammaproteobacteria bacterium]|nr:flagellar motor switch protein FliM [Gammaproteobacteria bacterium]
MSGQDILGQDEIDALINGAQQDVPAEPAPAEGEARGYDFGRSARIVRGRMPTLEMVNDRFARLFRTTIYNMLRRTAVVAPGTLQFVKFGDYVNRLKLPTSLNLCQFAPLRGTGLLVLEPTLVFAIVDIFFGGKGRHAKIEGREFSAIENSIVKTLLNSAFENIREAWAHIIPLHLQLTGSEINPHFANIVGPTEIVVVSTFNIEIDDDQGGDFQIVLPYSMIEPLREVLESGMQSDRVEHDDRWTRALRAELEDAEIEVRALLGRVTLKLSDVMNLAPGDVLPSDFSGQVTLFAEDVPVFRGVYGRSGGQHALKVSERVSRTRQPPPAAVAAVPGELP